MTSDHHCKWCGRTRGILPTGILICSYCDLDPNLIGFPNLHLIKDVRPGQ